MVGDYPVFLGSACLGKVTVRRTGLYYRFVCNCKLPRDAFYRLRIFCEDTQENLGVLVPDGDRFVLDTKLPVKKFGQVIPEFQIVSNHEKTEGYFIPVYPDEPFAYISRLKDAYLIRKKGCNGVMLK